jgi:predicted metalloprotease with PDZ domain
VHCGRAGGSGAAVRTFVLALALLASAPAAAAVDYRVELGARSRHQIDVELTVTGAVGPVELWMPVWTPGAYELRTWGRNLTPIGASDGDGHTLPIARTSASSFRVEGTAPQVRVRYRVYAARLTDDGSHVDGGHALINGSSTFLAVRGQEASVHTVHVALPAGWRAATALTEATGDGWQANGYEALIDAPIECGRLALASKSVGGRVYRVAIDGPVAAGAAARLAADVARVAVAESSFVGAPPFRQYLAIVHLADEPGRVAALEHAASTSILVPRRSLADRGLYDELVYVVAHELFHAWNARKLRPAELVPYDLQRPQPSRALWIIEGLTEYYAHRAMLRMHRWDAREYLAQLSDAAADAATAARRGPSLEEAGLMTWQMPEDGGEPDAYYARGHLVALALDAAVRVASDGKRSLDDALRMLLEEAERKGGVLPVDTAALARALDAVAPGVGDKALAWARRGDETAQLAQALAGLGLRLAVVAAAPRTIAGFAATPRGSALMVESVRADGPAGLAGLKPADRIVSFDGGGVPAHWAEAIAARAPGTTLVLGVTRGERALELRVTLEATVDLATTVTSVAATPAVARLREAFLAP